MKHICPVCHNPARSGTFLCIGCTKWIHPKCGGYSQTHVQSVGISEDGDELRCKNCKTEL